MYKNTLSIVSHAAEPALPDVEDSLKDAVLMTGIEKTVMSLILVGMSNGQIAERLAIPSFQVKSHVDGITDKLALRLPPTLPRGRWKRG